jgi:hypothetical protein
VNEASCGTLLLAAQVEPTDKRLNIYDDKQNKASKTKQAGQKQ